MGYSNNNYISFNYLFNKKTNKKEETLMGFSNMHKRRKYNFNHNETATIEVALENLEELFIKNKNYKEANSIKKVRKSLIHQEQAHWNYENGYPKGYLIKKSRRKK